MLIIEPIKLLERSLTMHLPNAADKLLLGSKKVDAMKMRMEKLVSVMLGLAKMTEKFLTLQNVEVEKPIDLDSEDAELHISDSESCRWRMLSKRTTKGLDLRVECSVCDNGVWTIVYDSKHSIWRNRYTKDVYINRNQFVNFMYDTFPQIGMEWQYIFEAANMPV